MSNDEQQRRPEARKPRGFPDRTAAVIATERRLVDSISAVYQRWGFDALGNWSSFTTDGRWDNAQRAIAGSA